MLLMLINFVLSKKLIEGKNLKTRILAFVGIVMVNILVTSFMHGKYEKAFYFIPIVLFPSYKSLYKRKKKNS
jgi:hypothetical protein